MHCLPQGESYQSPRSDETQQESKREEYESESSSQEPREGNSSTPAAWLNFLSG